MHKTLTTLALLLAAAIAPSALASGKLQGYAEIGGQTVLTSLTGSSVSSVRLCPGASVTPLVHGTSTGATTYRDEALTQPNGATITANSRAEWAFYAANGTYDLQFSGCGSSWTVTALSIGSSGSSGSVFNVKEFGAKGDLRLVTDGAISNGSTVFSSSTAAFTSADVGKEIEIGGAGAAGVTLYTTIATFTSASQVGLTLAASTGVSNATTRVYTDDGVAIIAAQAAHQAAGRGTFYYPPGTYGTFGKGTVYASLGTYTAVTGITLQCDGCKLYISGEHTVASSSGSVFTFSQSSLIGINGFNVEGEMTAAAVAAASTFKGIEFLHFVNGCSLIDIPTLRVSGIGTALDFYNSDGAGNYDNLPHTSQIWIGSLSVSTSIYGMISQWSGDDMTIDRLNTDTCLRSFFIYGSSRVKAHIYSKNAKGSEDVKLWSGGGFGNSDIEIWYYSDATSTARTNNQTMVELQYNGTAATTHKSIALHFDVVFPGLGTANTGMCVFMIRKRINGGATPDTVDRGHMLDGLYIDGRIENYPQFAGFGLIDTDPAAQWGSTLDSWYNINLANLHIKSAVFSRLSLAALKGMLTVSNFQSDADLILQQSDYVGAVSTNFPAAGQTKIINSSYPNQYVLIGSDRPSGVVYVEDAGNLTVTQGWQDQTIVNTGCTATCTPTLPAATVGRSYSFVRVGQVFRIAPQAADQIRGSSAANKYIQLDAVGFQITLTCTTAGFWDTHYFGAPTDVSFQP